MDIYLHSRLTVADQAIILKYLLNPRALSKDEWVAALAAFDLLSACRVAQSGQSRTFAQFYEDVFDRPHASALLGELLAMEEVESEGARRAEAIGRQVWAELAATELRAPLTTEQRLLAAYCLYWWSSFAKGYITEIAVFRDLARAGISFEAHDLSQPGERYSPDDLHVSGLRGDIKSSSYFLHSARHFPLRHDFYITTLFDPRARQRRRVVMMQTVAWDRIDGETQPAELEQAVALLPQPVAVAVKGQGLVVVDYNLWKEKIRAFQQRGESYE